MLLSLLALGIALFGGLTASRAFETSALAQRPMEQVARDVHRLAQVAVRGRVRVGIQIGHEQAAEQPDELASLRQSTGGYFGGVAEVDINRQVATALKRKLEAEGVAVDLIPATVPQRYTADLFLSLHADSSPEPQRRGYKSAHFEPPRNWLEPQLKTYIDQVYFDVTALPDDHDNVTRKMIRYYAFNHQEYLHAIHPATPGVIVEMGYISHPDDREFLRDPSRPASAIADGVLSYLRERNRLPPQ